MNIIFKVAKTELRNLFYSPIAWFLTIAFFVQCAITYTKLLGTAAATQEMGGIQLSYVTQLTAQIFTKPYGLFPPIMQNLYLYIPLLTMGLISREINGGTISLLYSSPIKIREIVFGKYLAMLLYNLILVAIIGVFMIAGVLDIRSADWGMLLSAALGFYLLLAAYAAIGLFMSSLTSYQVVAAVSTFIMIGILSYIGTLWQGIDFVRDLTYFLSISGRTQHMLVGLISTKDVIYFVIIVYLFLAMSIYKLRFSRETKSWQIKTGAYVLIVTSALLVGYITSLPGLIGYWDTTANNDNTLTPNAQKIIRELGDDPLEVTIYSNYLDNMSFYGLPEQQHIILSLWEPYLRFKPNITVNFVNYYDRPLGLNYNMFAYYKGMTMKQIVAQKVKGQGLDLSTIKTPEQMRQIIDLKPELNRYVMLLRYKGKTTFLRVFDDQMVWPSETEVTAAFKRLLQAKMPKIGFIDGDGERNPNKKGDRGYKLLASNKPFRFALINQGFDIDSLYLDKQDIPSDLTALVLADPQTALSPVATQKINDYIAKGGNLLIAGEPGRQQLTNPLLKQLGVQLNNGMLVQKSDDNAPWLMLPNFSQQAIALSGTLNKPSIDTLPVSFNGASALSYTETNGFKIFPLLETRSGTVHNSSMRNPDLDLVANVEQNNAAPVAMAHPGGGAHVVMMTNHPAFVVKKAGAVTATATANNKAPVRSSDTTTANKATKNITAVALTRQINGKEQRIIVSSDADFMSNLELNRYQPRTANFVFNTALFSWMDNGQFPIDTSRPDAKDNRVTISTDRVGLLKIWYIWVLPAVLLALGSVLLIRRRRK